MRVGAFEVSTPWQSFALASGDMWPNVRGYHSKYYAPAAKTTSPWVAIAGAASRKRCWTT